MKRLRLLQILGRKRDMRMTASCTESEFGSTKIKNYPRFVDLWISDPISLNLIDLDRRLKYKK